MNIQYQTRQENLNRCRETWGKKPRDSQCQSNTIQDNNNNNDGRISRDFRLYEETPRVMHRFSGSQTTWSTNLYGIRKPTTKTKPEDPQTTPRKLFFRVTSGG